MATLSVGGQLVATNDTLSNAVQDNITRLGTVTSGADQFSSMVKLASSSSTTNVTYVDVEGVFDDSIYLEYFWSINEFAVNPWAAGGHPRFEFLTASNTPFTSSNYQWIHSTGYANASQSASNIQSRAGRNDTSFEEMDGTWNWLAGVPSYWHIWITNPTASGKNTMMRYNMGVNMTGTDYMLATVGNCMINNDITITGARMQFAGTTCGSHQYVLYGIKK